MPATGKVSQVIGSTFDVAFPEDQLPLIYNAVEIEVGDHGSTHKLVGEVQQHLGGGHVRAVALGSTDGLRRGMDCRDTGSPVTVPVGKETLGRVFNLLGEPIDNLRSGACGDALADSSRAAGVCGFDAQGGSV